MHLSQPLDTYFFFALLVCTNSCVICVAICQRALVCNTTFLLLPPSRNLCNRGNTFSSIFRVVHLLFAANRFERLPEIRHLLKCGVTVILNRYSYTAAAITAAKTNLPLDWTKNPERGMLQPDLTIYLEQVPKVEEGTEHERYETRQYQMNLWQNFQELYDLSWVTVNIGELSEDAVYDKIYSLILFKFSNRATCGPLFPMWTV